MNIRLATLADIQEIAEIKIDSPQVSDHQIRKLFVREFRRRWKQRLQEGKSTLVLSEDRDIAGFISYTICTEIRHAAEINNLYILPDKRRQHLGTLLCNAALDRIKDENFQQGVVWVPECSHQAANFYERLGFTRTTEVRTEIIRVGVALKEFKYQIDFKTT